MTSDVNDYVMCHTVMGGLQLVSSTDAAAPENR